MVTFCFYDFFFFFFNLTLFNVEAAGLFLSFVPQPLLPALIVLMPF